MDSYEKAAVEMLNYKDCKFLSVMSVKHFQDAKKNYHWHRAMIGRARLAWIILTGGLSDQYLTGPTPRAIGEALLEVAKEMDQEKPND